jgi:hypothetical protein
MLLEFEDRSSRVGWQLLPSSARGIRANYRVFRRKTLAESACGQHATLLFVT